MSDEQMSDEQMSDEQMSEIPALEIWYSQALLRWWRKLLRTIDL